jgi:hypothetical protein
MGLLPPGLLGGLSLLIYYQANAEWLRLLTGILFALAILLLLVMLYQLNRPRIAYRNGQVLFYLRAGKPIEVPVEVVEAFFFGQGLANLPPWLSTHEETETVNLVARLSQRFPQWSQMCIKPALGRWQEGYVVLNGSWCEPLSDSMIRRLNRRLGEVTRAQKGHGESQRELKKNDHE